jgi:hypothetical protein
LFKKCLVETLGWSCCPLSALSESVQIGRRVGKQNKTLKKKKKKKKKIGKRSC